MNWYRLSNAGGDEQGRWIVYPTWPFVFGEKLQRASRIKTWDESKALIKCAPPRRIEDFPCSVDGVHLVSNRLRVLLEREAPGCAQFLPVSMVGPGGLDDDLEQRYWVANWLTKIDCIDRKRSLYFDDTGRLEDLHFPVIDVRRIPPDIKIGRMKDRYVITMIREDLKRTIEDAGMMGPQFGKLWHHTDASPDPRRKRTPRGKKHH